jgi:hypothetical protein
VNIALDFDDTYTRDPTLWNKFIEDAKDRGHDIRVVTFRKRVMEDPAINYLALSIPVIYTEGNSKRSFCNKIGWIVDIWIDDSPEFIVDIPLIGISND